MAQATSEMLQAVNHQMFFEKKGLIAKVYG